MPTGEKPEVASFLKKPAGMGPKIAMKVCTAAEHRPREGLLNTLGELQLLVFTDFLLADVRRVPYDGVKRRQNYGAMFVRVSFWELAESSARHYIKEISARNPLQQSGASSSPLSPLSKLEIPVCFETRQEPAVEIGQKSIVISPKGRSLQPIPPRSPA